ncbi:RmlC-like cupin domain-containing protein [Naematelia encephala]|uniref:RmlC-like cupin domain-containing protein n=1 Tax=Naematelia encephala TaxID=71784 RepID=A0A1Y2ASJ8_9TREE|nr:RmlC-like cupin domain-containing protein [Naematelia encephala]
MSQSKMQFQFRPSETRGGADHGWLKTFHTFSFAEWYDPRFEAFGSLRVINEDRVAPKTGFPTHPHREFEIFSYLLSGKLSHKDSMGNVETMVRGDVQMTSGGTGIRHSEYNDHDEEVHFLQIWAKPNQSGLKPQYFTRHYTDAEKTDKLIKIVAPIGTDGVVEAREGDGPTPVHAPLHTLVTLLSPSKSVTHTVLPPLKATVESKLVLVQVVQSSGYNTKPASKDPSGVVIKVSGGDSQVTLGEGDAVFIREAKVGEEIVLENVGSKVGEVVVFEMDA